MFPPGTVLLAKDVPDPQGGNPKTRPVVALRFRDEELYGIGVTTSFTYPLDRCSVKLAYAGDGACRTGLDQPAVALIRWAVVMPVEAIVRKLGFVGDAELADIMERVVNVANGRDC